MIKKFFKSIFTFVIKPIIDLWNIYGGVLLSMFIGKLTEYNKNSMDTFTSFIIMTLACIGALTFIKVSVFKKKANKLDTVVSQQSSIKTIKTAIDPVASGEELGKMIIETTTNFERIGSKTMEKIKAFFKKLWGNKFTLISIITNSLICAFVDYLILFEYFINFEWFKKNQLAFTIGVIVITVLVLIVTIYTVITKYGWESLNELNKRIQEKKEYKASRLSSEQKHVLKNQIAIVESGIKDSKARVKTYTKIIDNFQVLQSVGITPTSEKVVEYNDAVTQKNYLEQSIVNFEQQLIRLKEKLNG